MPWTGSGGGHRSLSFGPTDMQKLLKLLFATAFVLGLASTIAAGAHPIHHTDLMRDGHSQRPLPVDTSHWLLSACRSRGHKTARPRAGPFKLWRPLVPGAFR